MLQPLFKRPVVSSDCGDATRAGVPGVRLCFRRLPLLALGVVLVLCVAAGDAGLAAAEPEGFFVGQLSKLGLDGAPKSPQTPLKGQRISVEVVHVPGCEAVVFDAARFRRQQHAWNVYDGQVIAIRGQRGKVAQGTLLLEIEEGKHRLAKFQVTLDSSSDDFRKAFWRPWYEYYRSLGSLPGGAWHRRQVRRAQAALQLESNNNANTRRFLGIRSNSADDTLALMSGGRAVSENLQLDREIPIRGADSTAVPLDSIQGVTVKEFDWTPLVKDLKPELDPLAALIPADQHALFLPSFQALVTLVDDIQKSGSPLLQIAAPTAESSFVQQRYERQLCMSLNAVSRLAGPQLINSMAMTGGDIYFRTGTDVAVLMETSRADALLQLLRVQQTAAVANRRDIQKVSGEMSGVPYTGVRSDTRDVSSYIAHWEGVVVVSNSLVQLRRIVDAKGSPDKSLAQTDEYTFFRDRYKRSEEETGLVVLSDATIRRWCGPRWRIGASRRTRVAAAMAEVQAEFMASLVTGTAKRQTVLSEAPVARGVPFLIQAQSIHSKDYGDLGYLTPISEMDFASISREEANMYRRWRDGYQRNWSNYFDPIAVRFAVEDEQVFADTTVMPLIARSAYGAYRDVSLGSSLDRGVGDPHGEAMMQWMLSVNTDSEVVKQYTNLLRFAAPQLKVDPTNWIGEGVSLYIDEDPLWEKALKAEEPDEFLEDHLVELPVALHVEVKDALKLTLFMAGLRAYIEQTAPGVTTWEAKEYKDEPYVKVSATERARRRPEEDFSLYYVATGEGLTISLNESVIQRALERRIARRKGPSPEDEERGKERGKKNKEAEEQLRLRWPGQNLALRVSSKGLRVFQEIFGRGYADQMRRMSFNNLHVLNEWKRLFPELDPVELHEQFWQRRLLCPGGGEYVWNEQLMTMESTVFGSPYEPKEVGMLLPAALRQFTRGEFGIQFEHDGLRSRFHVERQ